MSSNPFLWGRTDGAAHDSSLANRGWAAPFHLPPFAQILPEHFLPAAQTLMAAHRDELAAIRDNPQPPSFENTILALERSGDGLNRLEMVFGNLTASATSPQLQAVELELNPMLAEHRAAKALDAGLFARIDAVYAQRHQLQLDAEAVRLVERIHLDFVLAGARLQGAARDRHAAIVKELAQLSAQFSQNVLADESAFVLQLKGADDLAGLPDYLVAAARAAAQERQLSAPVIPLSRSLVMPFLTYSSRRDLRQTVYQAWVTRGEHDGPNDNRPLMRRILALRQEQARLHGYPSYADYVLSDTMAGTPQAALGLLRRVWEPAKQRAAYEEAQLRTMAASLGEPTDIQPWDWRYLAEKVRAAHYQLDDDEVMPYFALESVRAALFDTAKRLFGVTMLERHDLPAYHADVRTFEVHRGGELIGLFQADDFARPNKRGGAWMSELQQQARLDGPLLPVVLNNNNFNRGEPTLLSFDDVRTMFHEFGHGLHGLLSNVTYPRLSGPNVLWDFVELPSQILENWAMTPELLQQHARHHQTGEPIPQALLAKMRAARHFNQGYETVEYVSCALVDLALHQVADPSALDPIGFEQAELERLGMPAMIGMRHRLPHFGHLFSGEHYASRYYVYMWAEVLDADGFAAFEEAGDVFDPATAQRLYRHVYSVGNTVEPGATFRAFRGRDPVVEPLLKARGLVEAQ